MRRLVCLLVALLTGVGGHAIMFSAAVQSTARFDPDASIRMLPAGATVLLGAAIASIALLTAAWSALGAVLVGLAEILGGACAILLAAAGKEGLALVVNGADRLDAMWHPIGRSLLFSAMSGTLLVEGLLTFVIALTLRARRNGWVDRPGAARTATAIISLLFLPVAIGAILYYGWQQYRVHLLVGTDRLDNPALVGLIVLLGAPIVLILLGIGTRWSGLGAMLTGLALTGGGAVAAVPGVLALVPYRFPAEFDLVLGRQIASGGIAAIGLVLLAGGIGSTVAGRIARRADSRARARQDAEDEFDASPFGIPSFN